MQDKTAGVTHLSQEWWFLRHLQAGVSSRQPISGPSRRISPLLVTDQPARSCQSPVPRGLTGHLLHTVVVVVRSCPPAVFALSHPQSESPSSRRNGPEKTGGCAVFAGLFCGFVRQFPPLPKGNVSMRDYKSPKCHWVGARTLTQARPRKGESGPLGLRTVKGWGLPLARTPPGHGASLIGRKEPAELLSRALE